jgi:hypothetical protein
MLSRMSVLFDYGFAHVLNCPMPRRILSCDMWGRTYWILSSRNSRAWNISHWIFCTYSLLSKLDNLAQTQRIWWSLYGLNIFWTADIYKFLAILATWIDALPCRYFVILNSTNPDTEVSYHTDTVLSLECYFFTLQIYEIWICFSRYRTQCKLP